MAAFVQPELAAINPGEPVAVFVQSHQPPLSDDVNPYLVPHSNMPW